jgi:outer membrane receptor for ferrienterochelin and colicin
MINALKRIGITAIVTIGVVMNSFSQSDSTKDIEKMTLKELLNVKVTTAGKVSQELQNAPATVVVITKEQIKLRGYRSLLDVLYDLPDMKVDDKAYSVSRTSLVFRGIQGQEKFLILLDGVRISTPSGDAIPIMENYPVNLAEQIEVVYGPASALYGADAVTSVINIITKKSEGKNGISVDASSMIGSYGYTNNSLLIAKKLGENASLVVSGQYSYDQGPDYSKLYKDDTLLNISSNSTGTFNSIYGPMTPKLPVKPGYAAPMSAYNMYASLHVNNFSFTLFRNYARTPSTIENNPSNAVYNSDVYLGQYINMANATYKKEFRKFASTSSLIASEYDMDPKSNYRNLYTGMEKAYKYVYNTMIKAEQQIDWTASEKFNATGGVSYEKYFSIPWSSDLDDPVNLNSYVHGSYLGTKSYYRPDGLPAVFYTVKYHNAGSFLQAQYSPVRKLSFTVGVRYDVNSRYGNNFIPRMGLVYKPLEKTTIKLLYGKSFLAPNTSDFYAQWGSFTTEDSGKTYHSYWLHLPNTKLKPIISENYEVSIQQFLSQNFSFTVDAYTSQTSGLHSYANDNESTHIYNNIFNGIPVDYIEVFINQNRQEVYGGNFQLNLKNSIGRMHLNSYASISFVTGRVENGENEAKETAPDEEPEFISPVMVKIGTDMKAGKFSFSPRLILMGKQNLTGLSDTTSTVWKRQNIAGYSLLNLSLRYNATKKLSAFVNVTNTLNQKYGSVAFNMDLNKTPTEVYHGQHEDPIRIGGGINFNF